MDEEFICLICGKTFQESDLNVCEKCGHATCPRMMTSSELCGGEISSIEEYDEAMKANQE